MSAEQTKEKIINAAGELAAELGLDNVSTRMVAKRSGENIGSIHYHFGSKKDLFKAVIMDAMSPCFNMEYHDYIMSLDEESVTPAQLSKALRMMVSEEITKLFKSNNPVWYKQVVYQLLQHDKSDLYKLFKKKGMDPAKKVLKRFFHLIDPEMSGSEINLRSSIIRMPIFAHAHYMNIMLKQLGTKKYSEDYLQKLEDLLVKQTQLILGLPEDKKETGV